MPEKSHVTTVYRRSHGIDEAMKAGIGATLCSVAILAVVMLSMHMLSANIGHAAPSGRSVSLH